MPKPTFENLPPAKRQRIIDIAIAEFAEQPYTAASLSVTFMQSGTPPVYIGFGSMPAQDAAAKTRLVLDALARTGQRGLLATGLGGLARTEMPDSIFMLDAAPHDWLFPQMAAAVHHGGAGTTAAALRAGIPALICLFLAINHFGAGGWRRWELGRRRSHSAD